MIKFLAFGLGAGAGIQAWRNFPNDGPIAQDSVAFVFVVGLLLAYFGGKSRRVSATATATATAIASSSSSSSVNVINVMPGQGARPNGVQYPSDSAPWISSRSSVPELSSDQFEGLDLDELLDQRLEDRPG